MHTIFLALCLVVVAIFSPLAFLAWRSGALHAAAPLPGRRRALFVLAAAPLAGCGVFSANTVNGVTTVTVNLASLANWQAAIANGVTLILAVPVVAAALGAVKIALIQTAVADMTAQVAALNKAFAGQATLTFTTASVPATVSAFQTDAQTISTAVGTATSSLGASLASKVQTNLAALETILSLAMAILPNLTAANAPMPKMSEAQALATLGVKAN